MSGLPRVDDLASAPDMTRTQDAIVAAYADLIEELGTDDVPFRLIARRAGVSERTIFRSYGTRVDLLLATAAWIERKVFTREESPSVFDTPLAIRTTMHAYAERPELAHVVAETTMRGVAGATPAPRRAELDRLLALEAPSVDEAERRAVSAALCHIDSAATWVSMRRELGMDARDVADAAAWAAEAVLDAIRGRVG